MSCCPLRNSSVRSIGERIRDKIAASKRKGMWMGGVQPFGYRAQDRKLVIIDSEAELVSSIFRLYTGGKDAPDTSTRRAGRFRRHKRSNYLRCCRAANRSATVAFATVPAAASIAAAMFGSSSAAFAPLNAL